MPFNKLHVPADLQASKVKAINEMLHTCLVRTCNVNPDDHFCLVARYQPDDMMLHPTFMGTRDPAATIVIEIALLAGRTDEQKESLYSAVREVLALVPFDPNNAIIFLLENCAIDWSFSSAGSVKKVLGL